MKLLINWTLIALAIIMRITSSDLSYFAFIVLILLAFQGIFESLQALFLSWLLASLNDVLFPSLGEVEVIRIALIFLVMLKLLSEIGPLKILNSNRNLKIPLYVFFLLCIVNSLFVSIFPVLSLLKSIVFFAMALTCICMWEALSHLRVKAEQWFLNSLLAIAVISTPLLIIGLGYEKNGTGFQGILNHPQVFGVMMGLLSTWQLTEIISKRLYSLTYIARFILCITLLALSLARTGMLSFAIGIISVFLFTVFLRRADLRLVFNSIPMIIRVAGIGIGAILSLVFVQEIGDIVKDLALKGDGASSISEIFAGSRGELMDNSIYNIEQQPIFGRGFGTPTYIDEFLIRYDPFFGVPVSAPIEKGVLIVGVVEELGFFGALFFVGLIYFLVRRVTYKGDFRMISLIMSALAINIGEAVLFAAGGPGLLVWLVIGMAATQSVVKKEDVVSVARR